MPEEWVTTPRAAVSSSRDQTALLAPRNLKEPVRWKFSHLKYREEPRASSRLPEVRTGVR